MVDQKPLFGYWAARGLGNSQRLILAATGQEFEEKRYTDGAEWSEKDKPALESDLANLPYLTFDGITVTEHDSICRVAAFRYKKSLLGKNAKEMALVENYFTALTKVNPKFRGAAFKRPAATDDERKEGVEVVRSIVTVVNKRLGEGKWIASEDISIADIYFWEMVEALKVHWAPFLEEFANLARFQEDFDKEEWFVNFKASGNFLEKPMYPPAMATLNNV